MNHGRALGTCFQSSASGPSGSNNHFVALKKKPGTEIGVLSATAMPPALPCEVRSPSKSRSTIVTVNPSLRADHAQASPTTPAPTTRTSEVLAVDVVWLAITLSVHFRLACVEVIQRKHRTLLKIFPVLNPGTGHGSGKPQQNILGLRVRACDKTRCAD